MKSILIVDDDVSIREILLEVLNNLGDFSTRTAGSGLEAKRVLESGFLPDLILLDLLMPGMDGREFLHVLKTEFQSKFFTVVMSAGRVNGELGTTPFLNKPFNMGKFTELVSSL